MKGLSNGTLFMVEKMTPSADIEPDVKAETFLISLFTVKYCENSVQQMLFKQNWAYISQVPYAYLQNFCYMLFKYIFDLLALIVTCKMLCGVICFIYISATACVKN